ncbi:MAG TPA: iron-containing alcohol dehydrogenase [Burkholderiaceae bacterium]|jgi:alcohol dehydrogenase class IV
MSAGAASSAAGRLAYTQSATEQIYVGEPAEVAIVRELERTAARRAFIVASGTLARTTDAIERIRVALGPSYAGMFAEVPAHGTRAAALAAAAAARAAAADTLIAIGGGSVIDTTKVVSICLQHGLTQHDDLEPYRIGMDAAGRGLRPVFEGPSVRIIAVPTTLSGAEFYEAGGVTDERVKRKQGYAHRLLAPRAIVLDPQITRHTPAGLWVSTGVRAIDHAVETLGSLQSNAFCDDLADSALRALAAALPRSAAAPDDLDERLKCMIGVWQSMLPLAGGVPMGISHATGHALGGTFGVPHGHTSCVTAPAALAFNQPVNAHRQLRISAALGDAGAPAGRLLDALIRRLGMPRSLTDIGLARADLPRLADAVMHDRWTRTNPRRLERVEQVGEFLETLF